MNLPVVLRGEASRDVAAAREYYDLQRPGMGLTFLRRVNETLVRIGTMPELYSTVWRNVRAARLRQFMHVVYYRVFAERIEVLAIVHGHRDDSAWQSRV